MKMNMTVEVMSNISWQPIFGKRKSFNRHACRFTNLPGRLLRVHTLFLFVHLSGTLLHAQQNHVMYFMEQVPQASALNPAYSVNCNYLGLPVLSSVHGNIGHTGFTWNQIFPVSGEDRVVDFGYLEQRLHRLDMFSARLDVDLLSAGMSYEDYFFTFRITDKAEGMVLYPKNLFLVPWRGNTDYVGETVRIKRAGAHFNYFREFSLTASTWLTGDLRVGIRPKLLFGKLNLNTRRERISITIREDNHHIDLEGSYKINASMPVTITQDADGMVTDVTLDDGLGWQDFLLNGRNPGFALDVGAVYTGLDDLTLYASILDMGFLHWSSDLNNFEVSQQFQFVGLDADDFTSEDYGQRIRDSLRDSWDVERTNDPYFTFRPLHTYLGMIYRVNDQLAAGVLQHNVLYNWRLYPALTLSVNTRLKDFLSFHASYSYNNYSFKNLGAGLSLQSNRFQFYLAADNLLAIDLLDTRNVNVRFGLNIFLGCGDKKAGSYQGTGATGSGCLWLRRARENQKILPEK